jgi:RHS repeat-associated protein
MTTTAICAPREDSWSPSFYRGEQYDPDLGLYYLRARYYNPVTGRFLNVDPMAGDGQRRYEYADADPVNGMDPSGNFVLESYRPLCCAAFFFPTLNFPSWCQKKAGNPMGGALPPCRPCTEKPGLSERDARYLCMYLEPMVAKIIEGTYFVDPALPLGLGFESGFATSPRYFRTGDAFGMSGGGKGPGTGHAVHASSPEDDVNELFSEPKGKGCADSPSYGERMRGTGSLDSLFLDRLEREDANGNQLTGPPDKNGNRPSVWSCLFNPYPDTWKPLMEEGINQMRKDIPIFLSSQ